MLNEEVLKFKVVSANENSFCDKIVISYGEHKTEVSMAITDLKDCNGLCATDEIAVELIKELEFGHNRSLFCLFDKITPELLENFKIYKLTNKDKTNIWLLCNALRGKHECVRKNP